jgi:hypothetical protein
MSGLNVTCHSVTYCNTQIWSDVKWDFGIFEKAVAGVASLAGLFLVGSGIR